MKHIKGFRTLNRTHSHRKALYKNMITAFFAKERIKTTTIKAKEIRRVAEKIITKAKIKNLHNIRIVNRLIKDEKILMKLFNEIAPRYEGRPGGYTRIIKIARRPGDGAEVAYLELVAEAQTSKKKKTTKKTADKKVPKKSEVKKEIKDEKLEIKEEKTEVKEEKTSENKTE
jgi:large subunit ribosomal protein L17